MSADAKNGRKTAKGALTKSIGRLSDAVTENFSARDIQDRIDDVKDALETSVERNETYMELCEAENQTPDALAGDWEANETSRVDTAVKAAIAVMRQLRIDADVAAKLEEAAEAKISKDRIIKSKRAAFQRSAALLQDSFTNFDKLLVEAADVATLESVEDIMLGQVKIALEELETLTEDTDTEAAELSTLSLSLNEKRRRLIKHLVDQGVAQRKDPPQTVPPQQSESDASTLKGGNSEPPASKKNHESSPNAESSSMLKMKVHATEPPKFAGSVYGWPTFISTWKKVIEPITSEAMLAHVLRCNLQGPGLKLIESCDDDYKEMIQRLSEEFGDPRKVTEVILNSLHVKPLKDENTKGFIEYVDLLEKADEKLRKLDLIHEISNSQVLGDIERRLPPRVRSEWAKLICEKDAKDISKPYQFLISFLKEQRKQIKYLTSVIRAPSSNTASSSSHFQGLQMEDEVDRRPDKDLIRCFNCGKEGHVGKDCDSRVEFFSCACCKSNDHSNANCDVFKELKAKERHAAIKKIAACFICFGATAHQRVPKRTANVVYVASLTITTFSASRMIPQAMDSVVVSGPSGR